MKRAAIISISGSGRSTFAKKLHKKTGLDLYHLDTYFWNEGWETTPREEWKGIHKELISKDKWIIDGNYGADIHLRMKYADTIFFFDFDRIRVILSILKRRVMYHNSTRPDMSDGCPERLDLDFLRWVWNYPNDERDDLLKNMEEVDGKKIIIFNNKDDVEIYLLNFEL